MPLPFRVPLFVNVPPEVIVPVDVRFALLVKAPVEVIEPLPVTVFVELVPRVTVPPADIFPPSVMSPLSTKLPPNVIEPSSPTVVFPLTLKLPLPVIPPEAVSVFVIESELFISSEAPVAISRLSILTVEEIIGEFVVPEGIKTSSVEAGTPLGLQFESVVQTELVAPVHVLFVSPGTETFTVEPVAVVIISSTV